MAYTVLARRYRSATFDDLVGQSHVAQTLKNAITTNRLAHAFLFTGTRGTGKTSSARILAKCINCESSPGPTPSPCGKCESCTAIARGDDIDVIEIDAASNTGVDDVRDVIENAQYRPARSRFKVYIIDEVHALSKNAFNALLKTLEEPPEHVKFILATTEVEKVLPTILSRCQRYDFRNIPTREIAAHLRSVCTQEKIKADDDAILLVAKAGAGSMRDALSLLDRLLSAAGDHLTAGTLEQLLGLPRSGQIFALAQAIGEGDVKSTLTQADTLITSGLSPETLVAALTDHFRNLLILKTCGKESELVEVPGLPLDELDVQAQKFDAIVLSQDIVVLEELRRQLRTSSAGRALVDALLVRLALAEQFSTVEQLIDAAGGAGGTAKKKLSPAA
ncbi:MAG TPA: DNA polymerase III subunit gamma/tau [Tepidisphaeraceae bacterium]